MEGKDKLDPYDFYLHFLFCVPSITFFKIPSGSTISGYQTRHITNIKTLDCLNKLWIFRLYIGFNIVSRISFRIQFLALKWEFNYIVNYIICNFLQDFKVTKFSFHKNILPQNVVMMQIKKLHHSICLATCSICTSIRKTALMIILSY